MERYREDRLNTIKVALSKCGLTLEEGGTLCQKYIIGDNKKSVLQIRACEVKYLREYCNIDRYIQQINTDIELEEVHNIGNEDIFLIAEKIAMRGKRYPVVWPWL